MKVSIQSSQVGLDKAIEAHIQRKLKLALTRMEPYITAISINLSDVVNQPINDGDKEVSVTRCCLQIAIANLPALEVEDTQTDLYFAIDRVIQKASRTMARKLFSDGINPAK